MRLDVQTLRDDRERRTDAEIVHRVVAVKERLHRGIREIVDVGRDAGPCATSRTKHLSQSGIATFSSVQYARVSCSPRRSHVVAAR